MQRHSSAGDVFFVCSIPWAAPRWSVCVTSYSTYMKVSLCVCVHRLLRQSTAVWPCSFHATWPLKSVMKCHRAVRSPLSTIPYTSSAPCKLHCSMGCWSINCGRATNLSHWHHGKTAKPGPTSRKTHLHSTCHCACQPWLWNRQAKYAEDKTLSSSVSIWGAFEQFTLYFHALRI